MLNGIDDTFTGDLLSLAIGAFSILLFVTYLRRSKQIIDKMQQVEINFYNKNNNYFKLNFS